MRRSAVMAVVIAGASGAARAAAQRRTIDPARMGPHIGYNFDADALTLGTQVTLPLTRQLALYPSFDYYFVTVGTLWAVNADLKVRPATRRGLLYVGGGLDWLRPSGRGGSGTTNLNLLAGLEAPRQMHAPYLEGRLMLGNGSAFQIVGGFNFPLH